MKGGGGEGGSMKGFPYLSRADLQRATPAIVGGHIGKSLNRGMLGEGGGGSGSGLRTIAASVGWLAVVLVVGIGVATAAAAVEERTILVMKWRPTAGCLVAIATPGGSVAVLAVRAESPRLLLRIQPIAVTGQHARLRLLVRPRTGGVTRVSRWRRTAQAGEGSVFYAAHLTPAAPLHANKIRNADGLGKSLWSWCQPPPKGQLMPTEPHILWYRTAGRGAASDAQTAYNHNQNATRTRGKLG